MFNVYKNQLSQQTESRNLTGPKTLPGTHNMVYLYDACDQISDFCHQQLLRKMRRKISWTTDGQTDRCKTVYIEHICTFFVTFFSATIDDRDLIFGHKRHIGTPYRGKCFSTHQIPTSCLPILLIFIHI